ncbi:MAG TPA: hypothetical protein VF491_14595 [Vicinamibacterales bacterium]
MKNRLAGIALALGVIGASTLAAQAPLVELLQRHGIQAREGAFDVAFDSHAVPAFPVTPGSFATPLALLAAGDGRDRIAAAYVFGVLAGRSGRAVSAQEAASAGQSLLLMIGSEDRPSRIAGARVAGRLFAAPIDQSTKGQVAPTGMTAALFALLNLDRDIDQLAAMDALGLMRETTAVTSLTERYAHYRDRNQRVLAGGALEALARIGDRSTVALVQQLASDRWADGKDPTALAAAFARERLLKDGSIAIIRQALDDKSRRNQARGYLEELGAPAP